MQDRMAFCTFGMFIIDQIEYLNASRAPVQKILGGAGTYAALGARLAAGRKNSHAVSWIVDMGSDFPSEFRALIDTWRTSCIFRLDMGRLSTTAWNGYGPNEFRAFKYLTPKLRLDEDSLSDEQALAESFHMVCSPERCMSIIRGILARRKKLGPDEPRPVFVWEPVPDQCTPRELEKVLEAIEHVDVISPNADEFAALFTGSPEQDSKQKMVEKLLGRSEEKPSDTLLVIREGAQGCTAYQRSETLLHLKASHQSAENVVDPTGGGNTFLGALAVALTDRVLPSEQYLVESGFVGDSRLQRVLLALVHATVAAGYAIEQVGMPTLTDVEQDAWNGHAYQKRFTSYLAREKSYIADQLKQWQSIKP
ncbi:Double-stranded RNA-containing particles stability [Knufia peltigerae]|uniref:Double-stranded RNA-containing particles stability n=1 Tax=Knufia peltigerae TaxID=1002370 RepID=A0AA39CWM1_9EURO|nr:Double-stranded RNA-containing particles stability [Knufia peltigerae]